MLTYFPADSVSLAASFNGSDYNPNEILKGVLSVYYNEPFTLPTFAPPITLSHEQLARYEGNYKSEDLEVTIKRNGDLLNAMASGLSTLALKAVSETEFNFDQLGA